MFKSLGIFAISNNHLDKIIKVCKEAKRKGIEVTIFFSHLGTLLTQDSRFGQLDGFAKMFICNVGYESHGLKSPVPGIGDKDYATQSRHVEMIEKCNRYIVF